jgi:exopolyphosphatase / guanosine-5'-triphosphate,3'-diphosphate pyrophosphatase
VRLAAIDIGTNSVLLLVASVRGDEIVPVVERATVTRLGQQVDASRALAPEAVARTLSCLERYAEEIRGAGAERTFVVGTSAMRDATNGADFVAKATAILGVAPRVVSGEEEAALTFAGALSGLRLPGGPVVVFDVGGGSTEIIVGDSARGMERGVSLDLGSVRLTERQVRSDPPAPADLAAAASEVRAALTAAGLARAAAEGGRAHVVGVAGTVTTLAAYVRSIAPYDGARVHGLRLTASEVGQAVDELARHDLAGRRAIPSVDPARADVIVAGGIIVREILAWVGATELIASDRGVRWGLLQRPG